MAKRKVGGLRVVSGVVVVLLSYFLAEVVDSQQSLRTVCVEYFGEPLVVVNVLCWLVDVSIQAVQ